MESIIHGFDQLSQSAGITVDLHGYDVRLQQRIVELRCERNSGCPSWCLELDIIMLY
jgi:hypothetical protein